MRKKILYFIYFQAFILMFAVKAYAGAAPAVDNPKNTVSSDGVQYFKVVSGDGVYLFGGEPKKFDIDEFRRERKAQKTDYITEEQIKQGYILWDGWLYPPNDLEDGDVSPYIRGEGDIDENEYVGVAHFIMDVPPGTKSGAFIEVMDATSYDTYHFEFFPAEHFSKDINMPPGTYLITNGGFLDTSIRSVASESYFRIIRNETTQVKVAIRDYEDIIRNGTDEIDDAKHAMEDEYADTIAKEEGLKYGVDSTLFDTDGVNQAIENIQNNGLSGLFNNSVSDNNVEEQDESTNNRVVFAIIGGLLLLIFAGIVIYGLALYKRNQDEENG